MVILGAAPIPYIQEAILNLPNLYKGSITILLDSLHVCTGHHFEPAWSLPGGSTGSSLRKLCAHRHKCIWRSFLDLFQHHTPCELDKTREGLRHYFPHSLIWSPLGHRNGSWERWMSKTWSHLTFIEPECTFNNWIQELGPERSMFVYPLIHLLNDHCELSCRYRTKVKLSMNVTWFYIRSTTVFLDNLAITSSY